jgi:hypothetical protein
MWQINPLLNARVIKDRATPIDEDGTSQITDNIVSKIVPVVRGYSFQCELGTVILVVKRQYLHLLTIEEKIKQHCTIGLLSTDDAA